MRGMRKIASLMLALCVAASASFALTCPEQAYAATGGASTPRILTVTRKAKKASLSRKKVTLRRGNTKTLKVRYATGKVRWSSTDKKIAFVKKTSGKNNQKAVIKARRVGTCYIKARIGKKTLKCRVRVKKAGYGYTVIGPEPTEIKVEIRELSDSSVDLTQGMTAVPPANAQPTPAFISAFADFSLELLKGTIAADRAAGSHDNVLISPDSVTTAFAMVENGAAGNTLSEIESALSPGMGADDYNRYLSTVNRRLMSSDEYIYLVSNSIWAREGLVDVRPDFLQTNKNYHDAEFYVAPFDTQTVQDINSWVYNKSRNMIDNILSELSEDARMVLLNTVAFEGEWARKFSPNTQQVYFTAFDGSKKKVLMLVDNEHYDYLTMKGGRGFAKYYRGSGTNNGIAFVGMLPPAGMSADDYIMSLSGSDFINAWNAKTSKSIILKLPKFKYDYSTEMGDLLQDMGIVMAFTDGADFSRMANPTPDTPGLTISKVLHKTHIDLDENGTRAAAATAVVMEKSSAYFGDKPEELSFDRPFVYALVDTATGLPLFIGEVNAL